MQVVVTMLWLQLYFLFRKLDDPYILPQVLFWISGQMLLKHFTLPLPYRHCPLTATYFIIYALWPTIKRRFHYYSHAKAVLYIPLKAEPKSLSVSLLVFASRPFPPAGLMTRFYEVTSLILQSESPWDILLSEETCLSSYVCCLDLR